MDLTLWPQRLGVLAQFAATSFPIALDTSSPADFLGSLAMVASLRLIDAPHLGSLCCGVPARALEVEQTLMAWSADEKRVRAAHPTNDNDEQSEAARCRNHFDDLAFKAHELYALAEALSITLRVAPMDGYFGTFAYTPGGKSKGLLAISGTVQDGWSIDSWTPAAGDDKR
jgi:hypothetical protein